MSEIIASAYFYADNAQLTKVKQFMDDNKIYYSMASISNDKMRVNDVASFDDEYEAYKKIKAAFPDIAIVGYEVACNCGEFDFLYSKKGSKMINVVEPYSYDDDDDPYDDEDEDDVDDDEDEDDENAWYEEIMNAVGLEAIKDLYKLSKPYGKFVFENIPGFENGD